MLRQIKGMHSTMHTSRGRVTGCNRNDLVLWYSNLENKRILRSRITATNAYGLYADRYPPGVPVMTVPWSAVRWSEYGWMILCDHPELQVDLFTLRTPITRIPKVIIRKRINPGNV